MLCRLQPVLQAGAAATSEVDGVRSRCTDHSTMSSNPRTSHRRQVIHYCWRNLFFFSLCNFSDHFSIFIDRVAGVICERQKVMLKVFAADVIAILGLSLIHI